jgi:tetratricopeptide (TPR) repeat protein
MPRADKNRQERNRSVCNQSSLLAMLCCGLAWAQDPPQDRLPEAVTRNNEGLQLVSEGRYAEAERAYRAALSAKYNDDLSRARIANNLAALYQKQDRYRDAEWMFRCALQWRQKSLPATSIEVAYSLNNLAEIYRIEGRDWEARNLLETSAGSLRQFHPEEAGLPVVLGNLALVRCSFGEFDQAEALLHSALLSYEKQRGTASREYGLTLNNLGQVMESKNELEAAAPLYAQAVGIFEHLGTPASGDLATALANTGELFQRLDRIEEARQAEQRALGLLHPAGDAVLRSVILRNLGNIVAGAGKAADSLPYFEQSLVIQQKILGWEHPVTAGLLLDYASATLRAGDKSRSRKLRKRAEELLTRLNSQSPDQLTVSVQSLRDAK